MLTNSPVWLAAITISLFTTALTSEQSCNKKKGVATVECASIEQLESNAGQIDVPRYGLGQIKFFTIDQNKCTIQDLGANIDPQVVRQNSQLINEGALLQINIAKQLTVNVQGNIQNAEAIKADLETQINNRANLTVSKFKNYRLNDIITLLNSNDGVKENFRILFSKYPDIYFFIVNAVVSGDTLAFNLDRGVQNSSEISLKSFGIKFNVKYNCNSLLKLEKSSLLYQYQFLEWDSVNSKIIPSAKTYNINKCSIISVK